MGYRSDVCIALYKKDFKELIREARKTGETSDVYGVLKYSADINIVKAQGDDDIIIISFHSIKWYGRYEEFIMDYLHSGIDYCFVRTGEDLTDVETEDGNDAWDLIDSIRVYHTIDIDGELMSEENKNDLFDEAISDVCESENTNEEATECKYSFDDVLKVE